MFRKMTLAAVLTTAAVVITACNIGRKPLDVQAWRANTVRMVSEAARGGAYAEAPSGAVQAATPYDTYFDLKTLQLIGKEMSMDHRERTGKWIKAQVKDGRFLSVQQSGDDVGEIFYGVSVMSMLRMDVPNKAALVQMVNQLQFPSGPFAISQKHLQSLTKSPDANDALLATYEALQALKQLGAPVQRKDQLLKWVQDKWDATVSAPSTVPTTSTLSLLAACLQIVSPTDPRLNNAWNAIHSGLDHELQQSAQFQEYLLMDVSAAVDVAQLMNVPSGWIPDQFLAKLEQIQNPDGGFNGFMDGDSDPLGTYMATEVLQYSGRLDAHRQKIGDLIDLHRATDGGYFPMSSRPSSLSATRGVVQAARFLGVSLDKSRLAKFLSDSLQAAESPTEIYLAIDTAQVAGVELSISEATRNKLLNWTDVKAAPSTMDELNGLYYAVLAVREIHAQVPSGRTNQISKGLGGMRNKDGGYGPDGTSSVESTARIATIFGSLGIQPQDRAGLVRWLQQRQTDGFGEPSKPATLEATYLALQALDALGAQPARPDAVRRWIVSCLKPNGGATFAPLGTFRDSGADAGALMWTGAAIRSLELSGLNPLTDDALTGLVK